MGTFFDTLDILGAHSGTSEPSGIINHRGRALRGDSKTKKCCQMHKLLFTVFVRPLYAHQETRVAFDAAFRRSQLIWSQNKCLDFHWKNWGCNTSSAVTPHSIKILKHTHTCWPETSQICHAYIVFIKQATIQGLQTIPPTSRELKFKRDSGIISPWCLPCGGDTSARMRKAWWGWWRRWA